MIFDDVPVFIPAIRYNKGNHIWEQVIPMRLEEHYIELRLQYIQVDNHRTVEVSIKELAGVLFCSTRNVKRIMNALDEAGLIYWKPGGGRGRRSKFQFKRSLSDVFLSDFDYLIAKGKFKEAIRAVKREGIPVALRERCYKRLMMALSLPRIQLSEKEWTPTASKPQLIPVMVATLSGRWFLVEETTTGSVRPLGSRENRTTRAFTSYTN